MEDYRAMILAELDRRGIRADGPEAEKAVTRMVRTLENELTEIGSVGVSMFVLGILVAKDWQGLRPV